MAAAGGQQAAAAAVTMDAAAVKTALTTTTNQVLDLTWDILPIALGLMGAFWGVKKVLRFFRSTAN